MTEHNLDLFDIDYAVEIKASLLYELNIIALIGIIFKSLCMVIATVNILLKAGDISLKRD